MLRLFDLFTFILIILAMPFNSQAQNDTTATPVGSWKGVLEVQGMKLPLIFHIEQENGKWSGKMDSPAQGAKDLPLSQVSYQNEELSIQLAQAGIKYDGKLINENEIEGTFEQMGKSLSLKLEKQSAQEKQVKFSRPQEPQAPFKYHIEEVSFENTKAKEKTILSGTLTYPEVSNTNPTPFPVVILISGSGAQDRNQEILGHKPFWVIADHLTKNGIAVLRYDDRGFGKSTGNFATATSADFAQDVEAAIDFLKKRAEIDKNKIGLVGHSEGGMIAPMVAANRPKDVAFITLLAGVGVKGSKLLLEQQQAILKANGADEQTLKTTKQNNKEVFDIIDQYKDEAKLRAALDEHKKSLSSSLSEEQIKMIDSQLERITNPWMLYFLRYEPKENLSKVKCPVLAVNGEKDLQVDAKINLTAIEQTLKNSGNSGVTIKYYPSLNHLFQTSETGNPNEYGILEETFSEEVLEDMLSWIKKQL